MDGSSWMMRGSVDGGELQRAISTVHYVVPCACRHKYSIFAAEVFAGVHTLFAGSHHDDGLPGLYSYELIGVRMYLHTDFAANRDTHQRHL